MAHPAPQLLNRGQLRRIQDCANENATLADCWKSDGVVIVAVEPSGAHLGRSETSEYKPAVVLDIFSPAAKPLPGSGINDRHPTRHVCKKSMIVLKSSSRSRKFRPQPACFRWFSGEEFSMYLPDAKHKLEEIFRQLGADYASMCIVSHDLQDSLSTLERFGIEPPKSAVLVDLVKVLEHQSRHENRGIPEDLTQYTDENITVRNGRYDRRPWPLAGDFGMPNTVLLEVLGPSAEGCRRDKTEKEDAALRRIAKRAVLL